jgi:hypothetical protein
LHLNRVQERRIWVEKWSCVNVYLKTAHRQTSGSVRSLGIIDESMINLVITQNAWAPLQPLKTKYTAAQTIFPYK